MSLYHLIASIISEPTFILVPTSFRMLRREGLSSESHSAASVDSINSGEAAGKPDSPTLSAILTRSEATLQDLFSIYPKAASTFRGSIRAASLDKGIKGADFQSKKERMLILHYLFENYKGLNAKQTRSLSDAVLVSRDKQKALLLLKSFSKEESRSLFSVILGGKRATLSKEEAMWRNAHNYASSFSDVRFLSYLTSIPTTSFMHDAAIQCEGSAYNCLTMQLESMVSGICEKILSIHKEECAKQIQRGKHEKETELETSRSEFVQNIADSCREYSRSYVALLIDGLVVA